MCPPEQEPQGWEGHSAIHLRHLPISYVRQKVFTLGENHSIFTWLYGFYLPVKALIAERDVRLLSKTVWTSKQMFFPACRNVTSCPVDWSLFGETVSPLLFWLLPEKGASYQFFFCPKRPFHDWVIRKSKLEMLHPAVPTLWLPPHPMLDGARWLSKYTCPLWNCAAHRSHCWISVSPAVQSLPPAPLFDGIKPSPPSSGCQ